MKRTIIARNIATGEVLEFDNAAEASNRHGFDNSHIVKCCRGKRAKHAGYTWTYSIPLKTLTESLEDVSWTIAEDKIMIDQFKEGDLGKLIIDLPNRNFREILCRSKMLNLERNLTTQHIKISPLDLIHELAEDTLFS